MRLLSLLFFIYYPILSTERIEPNRSLCTLLNSLFKLSICQLKIVALLRLEKLSIVLFTVTQPKGYETITVQEIIDLADVGRSTFYSHYESKELLLDELCQKLFHHLFERAQHLSPQDYLAHIFQHFKKNQDHVTSLLFSKNDYFIRQLRKELEHDVYPMVADELIKAHPNIPHSYLKHLVVSHFIETLSWWLKNGKSYSGQEVVQFYLEILYASSK